MTGPNPSGLCMCGCGKKTSIARRSNSRLGHVKGEPVCYVAGHSNRKPTTSLPIPNPSGLCMCGCGQTTRIATRTRRGEVWGEHLRFIAGHHQVIRGPEYVVDCATGCWIWARSVGRLGYGLARAGRTGLAPLLAHRVMYERIIGPIPNGFGLHHTCGNRKCVNPDHLAPMTRSEHTSLHMKERHAA